MRVLLYSDFGSITKDKETIIQNIPNIEKAKVLFVPYADKTATAYKERAKEKLYSCGISKGNIVEIKQKTELERFKFDLVYVSGGNTIQLLHLLKKYNQFDFVLNLVKNNVLYIGDSAGSVIAGNSVEYTQSYEPFCEKLDSYNGFSFIDKLIIVHAGEKRFDQETHCAVTDEKGYETYLTHKKPMEKFPHFSIANNQFLSIFDKDIQLHTVNWDDL